MLDARWADQATRAALPVLLWCIKLEVGPVPADAAVRAGGADQTARALPLTPVVAAGAKTGCVSIITQNGRGTVRRHALLAQSFILCA